MKRKIFSITLYILSFFLILSAVLATTVSFFLKDMKYYTELTFKVIEERTGYNITIDDINFSIIRGAGLRIDGLRVTDTARNVNLFVSKKVHIVPQFLPLFKKRLIVSKILIDEPEIALLRGKDGAWSFFKVTSVDASEFKQYGKYFIFDISINKLFIENGKVQYRDLQRDLAADFDNCDLEVRFDDNTDKYSINARAVQKEKKDRGTVAFDGFVSFPAHERTLQKTAIDGTITLSNISMALGMAYFDELHTLPQLDARFNGAISFTLLPDFHFSAKANLSSHTPSLMFKNNKRVPLRKCRFEADITADPDSLQCSRFLFSCFGDFRVNGEFSLSDLKQTSPQLDMTLNTNLFAIKKLRPFILATGMVPDIVKQVLQKTTDGRLAFRNIRFKGQLDRLTQQEVTTFDGEIAVKNASIHPPGHLPLVKIHDAALRFDRKKIKGTLTGQWLPGDHHAVTTEITIPRDNATRIHLSIDSTCPSRSAATMQEKFLKNSSMDSMFEPVSGSISLHTDISYNGILGITSEIDLTDFSYKIAGAVVKPAGLSNTVQVKGTFENPAAVSPFDIKVLVDKKRIFSGNIIAFPAPSVAGIYTFNGIEIDTFLFPSVPSSLKLTATLHGKGKILYPSQSASNLPMQGTFKVDDFDLREKGAQIPLLALSLTSKIKGRQLFIESGEARFGETDLTVSGTLEEIIPPRGPLSVVTGYFDIDDFVKTVKKIKHHLPKKETKDQKLEKPVFRRTFLDVDLKVIKVNFLKWNFGEGTSKFTYKNSVMRWDDIEISADNGMAYGTVVYDFSTPNLYTLSLEPSKSDIKLTWTVPGLQKEKTMTGMMNLSGKFTSTYNKSKEIAQNMEGGFHVTVKNGIIKKLVILSKILSMLDIATMLKLKTPDLLSRGMPFDVIEASFDMKHGIMETKNMVLKGPAMNLSAVGSIDVAHEEIDFTVGAQPFKTIGTILGNIPLAKDIFTGKDKSLTVGYFHIKGPYKDPAITPLPLKSLSSAVIKIFKSILNIPLDIIYSRKENGRAKEKPSPDEKEQ